MTSNSHVMMTHGLSSAEEKFVATILRLTSDLAGSWSIVPAQVGAPCDLLLCDAERANELPPSLKGQKVAYLVRAENADKVVGEKISRPIRPERLVEVLNQSLANRSPVPAASAATAQTESSLDPHAQIKLKRWPPNSWLGQDRVRLQLSSMLSRKTLSLHELSQYLNISANECGKLISGLQSAGLISVSVAPAVALAANGHMTAAGSATGNNTAPARKPSLFQSIRRSLGLA